MRHVRPSPERLEAQIRAMQATQEKVMKDVMECNKSLLETNRVLATELKENRVAMQEMKAKLDEMSRSRNTSQPLPPGTVPFYYPPECFPYPQPPGGFMPQPPRRTSGDVYRVMGV